MTVAAKTVREGCSTLIVKGLQKSYGKRLVVRDVSLQFDFGVVVGLLCPFCAC